MVPWSSKVFYRDRVLRERTGRSEDKRIEDSWDWEVLNKLCLIPSKFIKKYSILYTIPKGEILSRIYHTRGLSL